MLVADAQWLLTILLAIQSNIPFWTGYPPFRCHSIQTKPSRSMGGFLHISLKQKNSLPKNNNRPTIRVGKTSEGQAEHVQRIYKPFQNPTRCNSISRVEFVIALKSFKYWQCFVVFTALKIVDSHFQTVIVGNRLPYNRTYETRWKKEYDCYNVPQLHCV